MNQKALGPMDATPARSLRFLLCDTAGKVGGLSSSDEAWVSSPIQCLDKAVDAKPGLIVIRIGDMPFRERDTLVELSAALKRNPHTRNCPILALLHSMHRKLLEDLNRAGVGFVKFIGDCTLDSDQIRQIIDAMGPHDRLERYLETVCPFVHYRQIDSRHEMVSCGAYLDRMVLGGLRLHELCQTIGHLHCEYYLNPRRKS
ncbi:hypothetical protein [Desulfosarcina sp.]|uniref:hypothetical protein n=1 Tax=Desulfosarcina sp. TaxID=2027861 RepID=UPI0039710996